MVGKRERQRRILELIARNRIDSQEQLQDLLLAEGLGTVQSTLSRDLRELGVVKGDSGYQVSETGGGHPDAAMKELSRALQGLLREVDVGGNVVVLRAAEQDHTQAISARLEGAGLHHIVGVMGQGGTVLVVARSPALARELARRLMGRSRPDARRRRPGSPSER